MLSVKQVAARAGVSGSLVYAWCRDGGLRHSRFGRRGKRGCIRIAAADLDAFLAGCHQEIRHEAGRVVLKHVALG